MPKKNPRTTTEPITLAEAIQAFKNPDFAHEYAVAHRWPDGVTCPTCGSEAVIYLKNQRKFKCGNDHPRRQFSVKVGTIMEDSPIPLSKWLPAIWMNANCKNGISSYELARALDITQKSAWFMLQRIRLAMQNAGGGGGKLNGTVEVDETFIGARARNVHKSVLAKREKGRGGYSKAMVVGLLQRHGKDGKISKVRAMVLPNAQRMTLFDEVYKHVEIGSEVMSDQWGPYLTLDHDFTHQFVNHAEEYVRDNVHTNGIENFWSLLKRSLRGTYVSVEPFHLFRYVDEQAFRFNERKDENGDRGRFKTLLQHVAGKRLTYKELIAKDEPSAAAPA
jgi:hypothetical protein